VHPQSAHIVHGGVTPKPSARAARCGRSRIFFVLLRKEFFFFISDVPYMTASKPDCKKKRASESVRVCVLRCRERLFDVVDDHGE
jgi:hypothetical protein